MRVAHYLIFILTFNLCSMYAQEQDFFNEVLIGNVKDTIPLFENYIIDYHVDVKYFDEANFKEWWSEMYKKDTPSIETFFRNFNLKQLRSELFLNKSDTLIDFEKLNRHFVKIKVSEIMRIREQIKNGYLLNYQTHLKYSILNVSKPIFNPLKDWAIFIKFSENPYLNIHSGGELLIYQKLNCKWNLYHKFHLWLD